MLSKAEEDTAVENELTRLRQFSLYRLMNKGVSPQEAVSRIAQVPTDEWMKQIDKEDLCRRINSNKLQARWHQQQREKEKAEAEQKATAHRAFWNAKQFYRYMQWNSDRLGRALLVNDKTLPLIKTLCYFLSRDERFETELKFSFKKGLLLRGTSGLGKTHLVKCVADNELNPVKMFPVLDVMEGVKQRGEFNIAPGATVYIDDVGTETTPVKFYGTEINWVKDFIEMYYTSNRPYPLLMMSTNLSFAEIETKYGYRVRSRLREMVNVVEVEGEDLRQ